jgi:hypothetical protein
VTTHKGKIGCLPRAIREELNRRIDDGQQAPQILDWLNAEPAVQEALARRWPGQPINAPNLSAWRHDGYEDWRRERDDIERIKELSLHAMELGDAAGRRITEGGFALAAARIMDAVHTARVDELVKVIGAIHCLSAVAAEKSKLELRGRRLDQHDQVIALSRHRYQRETMELFLKWHENKKAREILESDGDNSAKIELLGREIFGDLWDDEWPGTVKEVKEN